MDGMHVLLCSDEVITLGITGLPEAKSMNADLKKGVRICDIMHSPRTGDERADELIDQGCARKVMFACSPSAAKEIAPQMDVNLDPYREHSREVTERMVADGFEQVDDTQRGESRDEYGEVTGTTMRRGSRERARHRRTEDVRTKYFDLPAQQTMNAVSLMRLPKRHFFLVDDGKVSGPFVTDEYEDPWAFPGLGEEARAAHLEWQREIGITREVVEEPPCPTPIPASPPAPSAPKPRGSAKKGMRRRR